MHRLSTHMPPLPHSKPVGVPRLHVPSALHQAFSHSAPDRQSSSDKHVSGMTNSDASCGSVVAEHAAIDATRTIIMGFIRQISYVSMTHRQFPQVPTFKFTSTKQAVPSGTVSCTHAPSSHLLDAHCDQKQSSEDAHSRGAAPTFGNAHCSGAGPGSPPPDPSGGSSTVAAPAHPQSNIAAVINRMCAS